MQSCVKVLLFVSNVRIISDAVNKRAQQDQVSFGFTLVVHLGCSGCLMFVD